MAVKIKWNRSALRSIRYGDTAPKVIEELDSRVEKVADRANAMAAANGRPDAKYATGSRPGKRKPQGRHRTTVITANLDAMLDNAKHGTLLKALFTEEGP